MTADRFHEEPFDEGTLTKLEIFELYAREWLPVFLQVPPKRREVHLFDFFAGPGQDVRGQLGSPLRLLRQLSDAAHYPGWPEVQVHLHLFDKDPRLVEALRATLSGLPPAPQGLTIHVGRKEFSRALAEASEILSRTDAAKLVLIDQFGVGQVAEDRFRHLISSPTCDFLFFISSSILNRFRDHPAIRQKIARPDDYYHVHRAVVDYYRGLVPPGMTYFLAPFSIKKGANIYGIIFGSRHPLGMDKFLQVAWKKDEITGEADFDILGDWKPGLFSPTKVGAFEDELEQGLRSGSIRNERDVLLLAFRHGVRRQHASPVLKRLRREAVIRCAFWVPQVAGFDEPRPIAKRTAT